MRGDLEALRPSGFGVFLTSMARTKPWTVSDEFWEKVEPLVPPAPSHAKGGRSRMDDRKAFAAIVYRVAHGYPVERLAQRVGGKFHRARPFPGMEARRVLRGVVGGGARRKGVITKAPLAQIMHEQNEGCLSARSQGWPVVSASLRAR